MERKSFHYRVLANLTLGKQEIADIIKVGELHYDGKCQQFAAKDTERYGVRGTLGVWLMQIGEDVTLDVTASNDDVQTICKILEQEQYHGFAYSDKWRRLLTEMLDEGERVNAHWMMNEVWTFRDTYRNELKAKYGEGTITIPNGR